MVRLIMSGSGEGKTKQLIELMENAADPHDRRLRVLYRQL